MLDDRVSQVLKDSLMRLHPGLDALHLLEAEDIEEASLATTLRLDEEDRRRLAIGLSVMRRHSMFSFECRLGESTERRAIGFALLSQSFCIVIEKRGPITAAEPGWLIDTLLLHSVRLAAIEALHHSHEGAQAGVDLWDGYGAQKSEDDLDDEAIQSVVTAVDLASNTGCELFRIELLLKQARLCLKVADNARALSAARNAVLTADAYTSGLQPCRGENEAHLAIGILATASERVEDARRLLAESLEVLACALVVCVLRSEQSSIENSIGIGGAKASAEQLAVARECLHRCVRINRASTSRMQFAESLIAAIDARDLVAAGRLASSKSTVTPMPIDNDQLLDAVEGFYTRSRRITVDEQQSEYQDAFDGASKGNTVLAFLKRHCPEPALAKLAYVSIGGGDGSEVDHVLRHSGLRCGIVVEYMRGAAGRARSRSATLAHDFGGQKKIEVWEGNVFDLLGQCKEQLQEWRRQGVISGVAISAQAVLHELQSREPSRYDPSMLFKLYEGFGTRIFHSREPAKPRGDTPPWEGMVRVRMRGIESSRLCAVCNLVKNNVPGLHRELPTETDADGFVRAPALVAIEMLHKILRFSGVERLRVEMEECLVGFEPLAVQQALAPYVGDEAVRVDYVVTETFERMYRTSGVEAMLAATGEKLHIPHAFALITGVRMTDA